MPSAKDLFGKRLKELRFEIQTTNIAAQLLPEKFTLSELQSLYETVLGMELDKRNFRKRVKELGMLKQATGKKLAGAHRPAQLFSFKHREYQPIKEKVHIFT